MSPTAHGYDLLAALTADTPQQIRRARLRPELKPDALDFLKRLRENAFDGLDVSGYRPNIQGWTNLKGIQLALGPVLNGEVDAKEVVRRRRGRRVARRQPRSASRVGALPLTAAGVPNVSIFRFHKPPSRV